MPVDAHIYDRDAVAVDAGDCAKAIVRRDAGEIPAGHSEIRPQSQVRTGLPAGREPDSNPRSHPTALAAAHIRPIIVPTPRRSSAAALADGFVPLESDRRPLPDPATSFANSRYFRPVRPKRPASTGGTRSSNPVPSSGESGANALLIGHSGGTPQARIRSSAGQRRVRSYGIALPSRQQIVHRASRPRQISGCGSE